MAEERFLDDFRVGEKSVSGGVTITEGEIIHFALPYKSQSFHPDVTAAEKSPYGGLIASGFHSLSLYCRLFMQSGAFVACGIGTPRSTRSGGWRRCDPATRFGRRRRSSK